MAIRVTDGDLIDPKHGLVVDQPNPNPGMAWVRWDDEGLASVPFADLVIIRIGPAPLPDIEFTWSADTALRDVLADVLQAAARAWTIAPAGSVDQDRLLVIGTKTAQWLGAWARRLQVPAPQPPPPPPAKPSGRVT